MPNTQTLKNLDTQSPDSERTNPFDKEKYNPSDKEKYWQDFWEQEGVYQFNPEKPGSVYTIDTPPPTVSGALHLGHIFSYTQAEIIARFKRMQGENVRYSFGLDNNGLPTERLVEKEAGIRGNNVNLEDFTKTCLEITEKYKPIYENLWKSIGLSVDWRLEYSTISKEVQKISQSTFKDLFERGIIYKKDAPALFCTECQTPFAQAEKEDKEKESVFYDLSFKFSDGSELIIATTRPELLPACLAVFINPEDQRAKNIVGKKIITPLGKEVEIIADEKVKIDKGSGMVMCCSYGDETDIYWTKKYNLKEKIVLDRNGRFKNVDEMPELIGKNVNEARKIMVEKLRDEGFIKKEEPIIHSVDVHERCGTPVEFLPTTQWFIKVLDMKEQLLEAGAKINWHPAYMKKRYDEWVSGLKWDWCISRERFYGIPVPAFNCDNCDNIVIPEEDQLPIDPKADKELHHCPNCKTGKLVPEKNVLDTWFTSALSPEINNSHPLNGSLNGKMYPMSMRPQAHDIIRTWAVYSILMGLYKHNEIPWKDLMISGHILAQKGEKISKKTGGGQFKPEDLVALHSADAIRYAMSGASLGKDSYFDEKEVQVGKKLVTKLYNAGKLVLNGLDNFNLESENYNLEAFDKWILDRSTETASEMAAAFTDCEFATARQLFEEFFWKDFCDNYLEIIKGRLAIEADNDSKKKSAQFASYLSFLNILKMASPFVPHITEEMFHAQIIKREEEGITKLSLQSENDNGYFSKQEGIKSIHNAKWPITEKKYSDLDNNENADLALSLISKIRKYKTDNSIRFGASIPLLKIKCLELQKNKLTDFMDDIISVAKAEATEIETIESEEVIIEMVL